MAPLCSEEEFLELWNTHGSVAALAQVLKGSERAINIRRRNIERRRGIKLEAKDKKGQRYAHLQTAHEREGNIYLGIENGTVIVFSDAHFWGTRTTAFDGLIACIKGLQPKAVICNGDAFDGAQISRHARIQWDKKPSVVEELKACEIALGEIEETAKAARHNVRLTWPAGNHDLRLEARLAANAPEFQGVKGFTLKDHFPAWEPCWATWPTAEVVVKHRWHNGLHATHNNVLKSGKNIVTGHLHSPNVRPWTDYNGTRYGVDTGTLADPYGPQFIDYTESGPVNWRSGFAVLTIHEGRLMQPEIVTVWDADHIEFRGQLVKVR